MLCLAHCTLPCWHLLTGSSCCSAAGTGLVPQGHARTQHTQQSSKEESQPRQQKSHWVPRDGARCCAAATSCPRDTLHCRGKAPHLSAALCQLWSPSPACVSSSPDQLGGFLSLPHLCGTAGCLRPCPRRASCGTGPAPPGCRRPGCLQRAPRRQGTRSPSPLSCQGQAQSKPAVWGRLVSKKRGGGETAVLLSTAPTLGHHCCTRGETKERADLPHRRGGNPRHTYASWKDKQQSRKHTSPSPPTSASCCSQGLGAKPESPGKPMHRNLHGQLCFPGMQAALPCASVGNGAEPRHPQPTRACQNKLKTCKGSVTGARTAVLLLSWHCQAV